MIKFRRRLYFIKRLFLLGRGPVSGLHIVSVYVYMVLALPAREFRIRAVIAGRPTTIYVRGVSDFWVIKDILIEREYDINLSAEPETIVDWGSNIGISVLYFSARFPRAHIYAAEPNPAAFELLRKNTAHMPQVRLFQGAISGSSGKARLTVGAHTAGGSLLEREGAGIEVLTVTPDEFLTQAGLSRVGLLKFDIEGAEACLFKGFAGFSSVGAYVGEMHYDLCGMTPQEVRAAAQGYAIDERYGVRKDRSVITLKQAAMEPGIKYI